MTEQERLKAVDGAANKYASDYNDFHPYTWSNLFGAFKDGVTSEAARVYWEEYFLDFTDWFKENTDQLGNYEDKHTIEGKKLTTKKLYDIYKQQKQ